MSKIAFFLATLAGGGVQRVALNLAESFVSRGHQVDFVVADASGPFLNAVPEGIKIVDLHARRLMASIPALTAYVRRERPDALLAGVTHVSPLVVWAKLLSHSRSKTLICIHTNMEASARLERHSRLKYKVLPMLFRGSWRFADAVVAVSDGAADELSRTAHIPRERITVIHNPFPIADIIAQGRHSLDHPWLAPGEPPVILAAGRLTAAKDYPNLFKAFSLVRERRSVRLVVLGEGELYEDLTSLARDLGITADLAMPGFDPNPYRYMARCGVFVLSSAWEGFGNVLVEAMACGAQLVSTDCENGPAEILSNGRYGRLVPVGDSEALAAAIEDALDHPLPGDLLAARAKGFSADLAADRYLRALGLD